MHQVNHSELSDIVASALRDVPRAHWRDAASGRGDREGPARSVIAQAVVERMRRLEIRSEPPPNHYAGDDLFTRSACRDLLDGAGAEGGSL